MATSAFLEKWGNRGFPLARVGEVTYRIFLHNLLCLTDSNRQRRPHNGRCNSCFWMAMPPKSAVRPVAIPIAVILVNVVFVACEPLWSSVCQGDHPATPFPFCDVSLPLQERVSDYVQRIPIPAQIAMMGNDALGYEPLGIPPYQWWSEGLHGPLEPCVTYNDTNNATITKCPTSFPCPSGLGNAFNTTLYRMIGRAIGKEGRAISMLRDQYKVDIGDGLTYWSPNVNLQRDPRWGRNQEGKRQ